MACCGRSRGSRMSAMSYVKSRRSTYPTNFPKSASTTFRVCRKCGTRVHRVYTMQAKGSDQSETYWCKTCKKGYPLSGTIGT